MKSKFAKLSNGSQSKQINRRDNCLALCFLLCSFSAMHTCTSWIGCQSATGQLSIQLPTLLLIISNRNIRKKYKGFNDCLADSYSRTSYKFVSTLSHYKYCRQVKCRIWSRVPVIVLRR